MIRLGPDFHVFEACTAVLSQERKRLEEIMLKEVCGFQSSQNDCAAQSAPD